MKKAKLLLLVFVLAAVLSCSIQAQEKAADRILEGLADFVEEMLAEWKVPGAAVAVVQDGEIVFMKGFGTREVGEELPVTPDTLFAVGSTTKAFTTLTPTRFS